MSQINHFDYFTDIEKAFVRRRGQHMLIGTLDWALMESWQKRGVPLRIVLAAIDEVFDSIKSKSGDPSSVRSLKYCERAVEAKFKTWREGSVGKSEPVETEPDSESDHAFVSSHVSRLINDLQELRFENDSLSEAITTSIKSLEKMIVTGVDEYQFDRLDSLIDATILENSAQLLTRKMEAAIETSLSGFDETARKQAYERVVCKTVRKEYGIPQLSIYEL